MVVAWLENMLKKFNALSKPFFLHLQLVLYTFQYNVVQYFSWISLKPSILNTNTRDHSTFNHNLYRYVLLNHLIDKTGKDQVFYTIFRLTNKSNYILNKSSFFWFLENPRLSNTLKTTIFYKNLISFENKNTLETNYNNFLIGFRSMWFSLRFWIVPLYLGIFSFIYMSFLRLVNFNILLVKCLMLFGVFYWLFSGFTFFLKKYRYRYFTSSLQRFWKRCYAIFWMLEFFTFGVFFYLTMMASQEPFFMYDNAQIFKTHLFSWRYFILKIFMSTVLIIFTYFLILASKWTTTSKLDIPLMLITFILVYMVWVEFYQFFHVTSYYGNMVWKLSEDNSHWFLDTDYRRTRINNHFLTICLMAKFWHIVFTLVFWMFFVVRGLEMSRVRYPLLAANFQNFIFVYILAWLYMYPWLKYVTLKLLNTPYYWFFVNNKRTALYIFFSDYSYVIKTLFLDILYLVPNVLENTLNGDKVFTHDFYYHHSSSNTTSYTQYQKSYIRDYFLKFIN